MLLHAVFEVVAVEDGALRAVASFGERRQQGKGCQLLRFSAHRRHGLHGDDRRPVLGSDGASDGAAILINRTLY